jgi:hypothetical protein
MVLRARSVHGSTTIACLCGDEGPLVKKQAHDCCVAALSGKMQWRYCAAFVRGLPASGPFGERTGQHHDNQKHR